jgi:hypothetical protein
MTLEERMAQMEQSYGIQSDLMKELRDAVTVMTGLEARQSRLLRDHSEWLVGHDKAMTELRESGEKHDREIAELRDNGKELDGRIANLVSGIGEFMRRGKTE